MGAEFTPGPWMAASSPSSVVGWPVVRQGVGRSICSVSYLPKDVDQEVYAESEANACLIAAAPELYEAANALIADIRRRYPGEELRCEYMRALDAALAKARGE